MISRASSSTWRATFTGSSPYEAVRTRGCVPPSHDLSAAAVEAVAEALGDAAESLREHWREAFRLAHPGGQA